MLPEPEVSIESNRLDIFCCGGPLELAPDTACMPPAALTPEISIAISSRPEPPMGPRLRHHVQGDVNNPFTMNWIGSRWDGSARGLAIEPGTRSAVDGGYLAYSSVPREI